jgi:hypothetical protein
VLPLFQEVCQRIRATAARREVPDASVARLGLLVTGIVAARSCVLRRVAAELDGLGLTAARGAESVERRLRRALNDEHLRAADYRAAVRATVDWPAAAAGGRVLLAVDDSSQDERLHLLRVGLCYWGGSLPLAWAVWEQNVAQPAGHYAAALERVLDEAAAALPPGAAVVLTADRAFEGAPFADRAAARGWHWAVRAKARADLRFRERRGRERPLRELLRERLPGPGRRWKARGEVFKGAGWRAASVVAAWAPGAAEPLVVLTDLPPRWEVLRLYGCRFWIEPGFRADKAGGWQWERSQVRGPARQARLLLALAWATLAMLCLGHQAAQARLDAVAGPPRPGRRPPKPQPPRESLFSLGLRAARRWLYRAAPLALRWTLAAPTLHSWQARWYAAQALRYIFFSPVRP